MSNRPMIMGLEVMSHNNLKMCVINIYSLSLINIFKNEQV